MKDARGVSRRRAGRGSGGGRTDWEEPRARAAGGGGGELHFCKGFFLIQITE